MTFREVWPRYLRAHRRPSTRIAHYVATLVALSGIGAAIYYRVPLIALAAIGLSYLVTLVSHRILEGNRSLVWVSPVWGALSALKMCWLALRGGLAAELQRHTGEGLRETADDRPPHLDSLRRMAAARQQP